MSDVKEEAAVAVASKLEDVLINLISKTVGGIEKGAEMVMDQLPEVIQQLLMWEMISSFIFFIISIIFFLAIPSYWIWLNKSWKRVESSSCGETCFNIGLFGSMLFFFIACITMNLTWLKIYLAPKVFLIEYMANLVK